MLRGLGGDETAQSQDLTKPRTCTGGFQHKGDAPLPSLPGRSRPVPQKLPLLSDTKRLISFGAKPRGLLLVPGGAGDLLCNSLTSPSDVFCLHGQHRPPGDSQSTLTAPSDTRTR